MERKQPGRPRGRPKSLFKAPQSDTVKALDRGIGLLKVLADDGSLALSDLAQRVDIPSSTTHRLLATLQKHGLVEFDEGFQTWAIGVESFRIGSHYLARTNLVDAARPILRALMEQSGETANLAIGKSGDVIFISQMETPNPIRAFFQAGACSPMHASGIGKALLAEMDDERVARIIRQNGLERFTPNTITGSARLHDDLEISRKRGWAYDDEERHVGMRCIAAGVFNEHGEVVAGISISGPTLRVTEGLLEKFGPMVRDAAHQLTGAIGGRVSVAGPKN